VSSYLRQALKRSMLSRLGAVIASDAVFEPFADGKTSKGLFWLAVLIAILAFAFWAGRGPR